MTVTAVKVFAKAPLPGRAKTRLAPALGEKAAAKVAESLLAWNAQLCSQLPPTMAVEYQLSPGPDAACWQAFRGLSAFSSVEQGEGDLGQRMARAASRGVREASGVILIGTDCPSLTAAHLRWAECALQNVDAAVIPATDGGYVLLALARECAAVFDGVAWSTDKVLAQTRRRLTDAGLRWQEHTPLPDLDDASDISAQPAAFIECCPPLRSYRERVSG